MNTRDDDWGSPALPALPPRHTYAVKACGCRIDWNSSRTAGVIHWMCDLHEEVFRMPWQFHRMLFEGLDEELHQVVMTSNLRDDVKRPSAPVANFAISRKRP